MEEQNSTIDLNEAFESEPAGHHSDGVVLSQSKLILAKKLLSNLKENIDQLNNLLGAMVDVNQIEKIALGQSFEVVGKQLDVYNQSDKIIEGIFDGEAMIGPDGKRYNVSANYASKSKLVEGDVMKLSITDSGTFVYKQIGPIDRNRIIGTLKRTGENDFIVVKDNKSWRVLTASVTYFKGDDGDEAIILVPKISETRWAAVENIIKIA